MTESTTAGHGTVFRAVYTSSGVYDRVLLPHYVGGCEDTDLVRRLLFKRLGEPQSRLRVLELGCGTGRVTRVLHPYARFLRAVDSSQSMIDTFNVGYPSSESTTVEAVRRDTAAAVEQAVASGDAGTFDLISAFWSLNYPIGEFFERLTAEGVQPVTDLDEARRRSRGLIADLVRLLAPGGRLIIMLFDAQTGEQRLVTRLWEQIAPFPDNTRDFAYHLLLDELHHQERVGSGELRFSRLPGVAYAATPALASEWFTTVHLKSFPALVTDQDTHQAIGAFIAEHQRPSGDVPIPCGIHLIEFTAKAAPSDHLPSDHKPQAARP